MAENCTNGTQYSYSFIIEKVEIYEFSSNSNIQKYIIKYIYNYFHVPIANQYTLTVGFDPVGCTILYEKEVFVRVPSTQHSPLYTVTGHINLNRTFC